MPFHSVRPCVLTELCQPGYVLATSVGKLSPTHVTVGVVAPPACGKQVANCALSGLVLLPRNIRTGRPGACARMSSEADYLSTTVS
jgi:hypothetical protein